METQTETRTCNTCGETKPLDKTHFPIMRGNFRHDCRDCYNQKRREKAREKQAGYTQEQYDERRAKERASAAKSRAKRKANETPEDRERRNRANYVRRWLPSLLKDLDHLRFVESMHLSDLKDGMWSDFHRTLDNALRDTYGCDLKTGLTKGSPYTQNYRKMLHESETYQLLNDLNESVKLWKVAGPRDLRLLNLKIAEFTEDEIAYARDYTPKQKTDELIFLSPAERIKLNDELDRRFAAITPCSVNAEKITVAGYVMDLLGFSEWTDSFQSRTQARINLKHHNRSLIRRQTEAERWLEAYPDQDLIEEIKQEHAGLFAERVKEDYEESSDD